RIDIFDSAKIDGSGTPGEIVAITGDGIQVAAKGGRILIRRLRAGGQKIPATEYAVSASLKVGDRFDPPSPKPATTQKNAAGGNSVAVKSDIEIAREAKMKPIVEVGEKLGIPPSALLNYGPTKAKVSYDFIKSIQDRKDGKLILVTAINPTPAGEGKTTTTVGLGDGLNRIGKKAMCCLREPSLGPCFGMKGGAAGGG